MLQTVEGIFALFTFHLSHSRWLRFGLNLETCTKLSKQLFIQMFLETDQRAFVGQVAFELSSVVVFLVVAVVVVVGAVVVVVVVVAIS